VGGGEIVCGVVGAGECGAIGRFGLGGFESVEVGTEADDGTHVSLVWTRAECQVLTSTLSCASNILHVNEIGGAGRQASLNPHLQNWNLFVM